MDSGLGSKLGKFEDWNTTGEVQERDFRRYELAKDVVTETLRLLHIIVVETREQDVKRALIDVLQMICAMNRLEREPHQHK